MSKHETSNEDLESLYEMLFSERVSSSFLVKSEQARYGVQYVQKSESAWILFVQPVNASDKLVIKILCRYQDDRYDLSSVELRQKCQSVALEWNKSFSPSAYYGLAPIYQVDVKTKQIVLGAIVSSQDNLEQDADYALVMRELPSECRLDVLIDRCVVRADEEALRSCIGQLVQHVVHIHNNRLKSMPVEEYDGANICWGSSEQLKWKLDHNLALANSTRWFSEKFDALKNAIEGYHIHERHDYLEYFTRRVAKHHIKRCHGDLKSPNIWVEESSCTDKECVSILDSIDFNPMYYNIDILSDFATLVVDIQTRTRGFVPAEELIEDMIEMYLEGTRQRGAGVLAVLRYYLFEKAYVGAAISLVYDDALELGEAYLSIAEERLEALEVGMRSEAVKPEAVKQKPEAVQPKEVPIEIVQLALIQKEVLVGVGI